jgi:UDP-2-acetamido-2,6-beta-L-arabino-hexul-4-ose reductase
MKVLVTGADGFIGKNLRVVLAEHQDFEVLPVIRATKKAEFAAAIAQADVVVHLAGVNRPENPSEFTKGNADFTASLCEALQKTGRVVPVAYSSSTQAEQDNPYGRSKLAAENHLMTYATETGANVGIYRLQNVFGKWCRPDYNSAVATFCHNIAHGLPVQINDPTAQVRLAYIDDVMEEFTRFILKSPSEPVVCEVIPEYLTTVGALVDQIRAFNDVRTELVTEPVGTGLVRALYATYMSYLEPSAFSYKLVGHSDPRGVFVEMLKTKDSGQFSYFTVQPGVTRGGHFHHTKSEKFLVVKGRARFNFRHVLTDESYTLDTRGDDPVIVDTIPGWAHDITNIGEDEMVVMLWANEVFDRSRPDTFESAL